MILDDNGLPILDQFSEEGFVDCIFKISDLKNDHGFYHFDLFASYDGIKVGFSVKLVDSVSPGFEADMKLIDAHVCHQGVSFRSIGQASDDLIAALAKLYGRDSGTLRMVSEETFTMIALQQQDTDLESHAVKMKLFGKDSDPLVEDDYYESFLNVDIPGGFVSWNEKDPDYRDPLIRALSAA